MERERHESHLTTSTDCTLDKGLQVESECRHHASLTEQQLAGSEKICSGRIGGWDPSTLAE